MVKISGPAFLVKVLMPIMALGILTFAMFLFLFVPSDDVSPNARIFMPIVLVAIGGFWFLVHKYIFKDLVEEVFDDGNSILVRNRGNERRIMLNEISYIEKSIVLAGQYILQPKDDLRKGKWITFLPRPHINPLKSDVQIRDLRQRIESAKQST